MLREFGIFIPVGAQHVVPRVRELLGEPTAVPELMRTTLASTCDEIGVLETNMRAVDRQLAALARQLPDVTLLQTVPGVGAGDGAAPRPQSRRRRGGEQARPHHLGGVATAAALRR